MHLKITCTCNQAKIAIWCQMPLFALIPLEIGTWGVFNMLNPNLQSDLLFGHSRHTNCIGRGGGVETSVATDASPLNNCISCQVNVKILHVFRVNILSSNIAQMSMIPVILPSLLLRLPELQINLMLRFSHGMNAIYAVIRLNLSL